MPLAIDLFCGLGGWTEGLLEKGWDVIGFDIERHEYWGPAVPETTGQKGTRPIEKRGWTQGCAVSLGLEGAGKKTSTTLHRYPAQLVVQDVLTLHGSQFKSADLIVASPPCQEYSYMAMPWSRAKQIKRALEGKDEFPEAYKGSRTTDELNKLFNACFRIQREACETAERHIPMVVENVRGAQHWVGRAVWNFGSYYLWGDVPALMPLTLQRNFKGSTDKRDGTGLFTSSTVKCEGDWFSSGDGMSLQRAQSSKSSARKHASAMIAKIPADLSRHIASVYWPR